VLALPFHVAMNPTVTELPAASAPLHDTLVSVTFVPLWAYAAFQAWLTVCPSTNVNRTVQDVVAAVPVFCTVTPAWKPVAHWLVTW
jgi:hypothetical protein